MRIGQLADKAGVNIQTIRFYERRKILQEPLRNASGYRAYGDADLENIRFVKQSQELGLRLLKTMRVQLLSMLRRLEAANSRGCPASPKPARKNRL
jgi:DNA-binding transcriptional MerR regulator